MHSGVCLGGPRLNPENVSSGSSSTNITHTHTHTPSHTPSHTDCLTHAHRLTHRRRRRSSRPNRPVRPRNRKPTHTISHVTQLTGHRVKIARAYGTAYYPLCVGSTHDDGPMVRCHVAFALQSSKARLDTHSLLQAPYSSGHTQICCPVFGLHAGEHAASLKCQPLSRRFNSNLHLELGGVFHVAASRTHILLPRLEEACWLLLDSPRRRARQAQRLIHRQHLWQMMHRGRTWCSDHGGWYRAAARRVSHRGH